MPMLETIGAYTLEQPDGVARLGADTLALSGFVTLRPGDRVCDLGCGSGALSLLMLSRRPDIHITAVDREPPCAEAALRNAARNGLRDSLQVVLRDWEQMPRPDVLFDVAAANPPYYIRGHGAAPPGAARARARVCGADGLSGLCAAAARITRHGARFALVYPAKELAVLLGTLRAHGWEPKRLRFAHHGPSKDASFVMAEARRGGKPGL
ncbi:MAG: methyltransferase, partial [Oscillospiraceae bacterium]|nr:methyltransferase [Oscillospiraceae bacterium]